MAETQEKTRCPRCNSTRVGWDSKKRWFDFLYSLIQQRPGRCSKCGNRFGIPFDPTIETVEFMAGPGKREEGSQSPGPDHAKEFALALSKPTKPEPPEPPVKP